MDKAARALPPLDLLRGFEAAARHLSFTRAAAELFVTQSAVSRQVQALEEFLGVELFERRHKALALTPAGHAYQRAVAAALDEVRDATRRLREARSGRVLTVTTTVSFASIWLVPRLGRWRQAHPRVDVRITATHEVVDMEREGIDVAIRDCALDRVPAGRGAPRERAPRRRLLAGVREAGARGEEAARDTRGPAPPRAARHARRRAGAGRGCGGRRGSSRSASWSSSRPAPSPSTSTTSSCRRRCSGRASRSGA